MNKKIKTKSNNRPDYGRGAAMIRQSRISQSSRRISDCDASHPVSTAFLPVESWVNMQMVPSAGISPPLPSARLLRRGSLHHYALTTASGLSHKNIPFPFQPFRATLLPCFRASIAFPKSIIK